MNDQKNKLVLHLSRLCVEFLKFHQAEMCSAMVNGENAVIFKNVSRFLIEEMKVLSDVVFFNGKEPQISNSDGSPISTVDKLAYGLAGGVVHLIAQNKEIFIKALAVEDWAQIFKLIELKFSDIVKSDVDRIIF